MDSNTTNPFKTLEFEAEIEQNVVIEQTQVEQPQEHKKCFPMSKADWGNLFDEILFEMFDNEKSFHEVKENFTSILLKRGISVNPQDVFGFIDMANTRINKIATIKRLALSSGLHLEWDKILSRELDLIYGQNQKPSTMFTKLQGEADDLASPKSDRSSSP